MFMNSPTIRLVWQLLETAHESIVVYSSHLGGVVVTVLATGPKGRGVRTQPRRWIFKGDKSLQHTFLRMVSKASVPVS
jgi:hypothetical protein